MPGLERCPLGAHHTIWCRDVMPYWPVMVEVHRHLSGPPDTGLVEEIIQGAHVTALAGQPILVPSLELELLILCLHAHQHNFGLLRCLTDLSDSIKVHVGRLDWDQFFYLARKYRAIGRVKAALQLAHRVLGLEGAESVLEHVTRLGSLQRWSIRSISGTTVLRGKGEENRRARVKLVLLFDSWRDVWKMATFRLIPPKEFVAALCLSPLARMPGVARLYYFLRLAKKLWNKSTCV
jgi:hypothetical protein